MKRIIKVFQNKLAVIWFHVVFQIPRLLNNKVKLHRHIMNLILLNLQSNQQIKLDNGTPLIIGRGNIEGCFDKRVSRNHGKITCTVDGKIRVEALHCNPCFFTRNGVPAIQQLNKDEEETLNEGDYLGLLPNAFWFKVTSNGNTENKNKPEFSTLKTDVTTDETNQTIVLENCNTSSILVGEITTDKEPKCVFNNMSLEDKSLASTSNSEGSAKFGTPEFEKTKMLPLQMYEIDDPVPGKSLKKHSLEEVTLSERKKQKVSSGNSIKKECEMKSPEKIRTEDKVNNFDIPSTSRVDEILNLPCKSENQEETSKNSIEKEECESLVKDEGLVSKRPICQYEDTCYRKNPQHKLDFCHPGDPDYVPHKERPTCQYGAACYRQNKQHKSKFRHPPSWSNVISPLSPGLRAPSPLPEKRTSKSVNIQTYEYEDDDDEYDLEEPFANDASSDDFIPSDYLGSEEEEVLDTSQEGN